MDKDYGTTGEEPEKYQCPETGSHFEFLDMCCRLKKLQTRRSIIDKFLDEQTKKKQKSKLGEGSPLGQSHGQSLRSSEKKKQQVKVSVEAKTKLEKNELLKELENMLPQK